jgi:hypothetical protein
MVYIINLKLSTKQVSAYGASRWAGMASRRWRSLRQDQKKKVS